MMSLISDMQKIVEKYRISGGEWAVFAEQIFKKRNPAQAILEGVARGEKGKQEALRRADESITPADNPEGNKALRKMIESGEITEFAEALRKMERTIAMEYIEGV